MAASMSVLAGSKLTSDATAMGSVMREYFAPSSGVAPNPARRSRCSTAGVGLAIASTQMSREAQCLVVLPGDARKVAQCGPRRQPGQAISMPSETQRKEVKWVVPMLSNPR
jgi:hypothetical protein